MAIPERLPDSMKRVLEEAERRSKEITNNEGLRPPEKPGDTPKKIKDNILLENQLGGSKTGEDPDTVRARLERERLGNKGNK